MQQRKEADGVQRLMIARMTERHCCPYCEETQIIKHGIE